MSVLVPFRVSAVKVKLFGPLIRVRLNPDQILTLAVVVLFLAWVIYTVLTDPHYVKPPTWPNGL